LFADGFARRFGPLLFYREEATDTVMVTRDARGERMLRFGDGRGTAGTMTVRDDRMYAHIPLLLHPAARRVLNICFGVGNSLAAVAAHPIERVDAVELSPGVVDAAGFFRDTNHDVLADPRVRLTIADGRNFLLASERVARAAVLLVGHQRECRPARAGPGAARPALRRAPRTGRPRRDRRARPVRLPRALRPRRRRGRGLRGRRPGRERRLDPPRLHGPALARLVLRLRQRVQRRLARRSDGAGRAPRRRARRLLAQARAHAD